MGYVEDLSKIVGHIRLILVGAVLLSVVRDVANQKITKWRTVRQTAQVKCYGSIITCMYWCV